MTDTPDTTREAPLGTNCAPMIRAMLARPMLIAPEWLTPHLASLEAGTHIELAAASGRPVRSQGGTAVLPLVGPIQQREDMWSAYGYAVSTEGFKRQLDAAVADDTVKSIVIDVDSPGGDVTGVDELAAAIFAARSVKPITAVSNAWMASAAYYLGSQATEIVVTPTGMVGSIGVILLHGDFSRAYEESGVTVSIIRTPARKAEANPYEPLSADARDYLQSQVETYYGMFVDAVARGRGVPAAKVRSDFGGGRMVMAREAVRLGMANRVDTLDTVLGRHGGADSARSVRADDTPTNPQITTETPPATSDDTDKLARIAELALAR